ncbi:hypothetical protein V1227_06490 [Lentzea sp. DG1S-22]|uniref:hypothetical protein n=1 Tax=Lentzea sp. DG1S-22 TaxID=3108822 RepID=UPI002E7AA337|nr:hypothetical protein [Lentzea sp. DG1S-22]WVH82401.1 hypothetical protein V1227_06490 [Lentzea sp. DG1S-22]
MHTQHARLLGLAGRTADGWLTVAREALADGDHDQLERLFSALGQIDQVAEAHRFTPPEDPGDDTDHALLEAIITHPVTACWRTMRGGVDAVYLVQAQDGADQAAIAAIAQRTLGARGELAPRVEVFAPDTVLPAYHEAALRSATLLWTEDEAVPVRVARTFDGVSPDGGPYFSPSRELVVAADQRQRLLDFLAGGEVVLRVPGGLDDVLSPSAEPVPVDMRSDGVWVWSDATRHYLDRYLVSPDPELVAHAASASGGRHLTHLDRYRVRAALTPEGEEGQLWRAG